VIRLFDGAAGDAGDEAVDEQILGDRHRDAGERPGSGTQAIEPLQFAMRLLGVGSLFADCASATQSER